MIFQSFSRLNAIKENKKRKTHLHQEAYRSHKSSKPTNVNPLSLGVLHQDLEKSFYLNSYPSSSPTGNRAENEHEGRRGDRVSAREAPQLGSVGLHLQVVVAWLETTHGALATSVRTCRHRRCFAWASVRVGWSTMRHRYRW